MKAVIEVVKGGGMVVALDAEAKEVIGAAVAGGAGQFFNLVQSMTGTLDRISRLPLVGVKFEKGARRGKAKRARA